MTRPLNPKSAKDNQCAVCGDELTWAHDHQPDNTGLDDGPAIRAPRKKKPPKSADDLRSIRARAWATRREHYGERGHR
jgi:hypothetical protein